MVQQLTRAQYPLNLLTGTLTNKTENPGSTWIELEIQVPQFNFPTKIKAFQDTMELAAQMEVNSAYNVIVEEKPIPNTTGKYRNLKQVISDEEAEAWVAPPIEPQPGVAPENTVRVLPSQTNGPYPNTPPPAPSTKPDQNRNSTVDQTALKEAREAAQFILSQAPKQAKPTPRALMNTYAKFTENMYLVFKRILSGVPTDTDQLAIILESQWSYDVTQAAPEQTKPAVEQPKSEEFDI